MRFSNKLLAEPGNSHCERSHQRFQLGNMLFAKTLCSKHNPERIFTNKPIHLRHGLYRSYLFFAEYGMSQRVKLVGAGFDARDKVQLVWSWFGPMHKRDVGF